MKNLIKSLSINFFIISLFYDNIYHIYIINVIKHYKKQNIEKLKTINMYF